MRRDVGVDALPDAVLIHAHERERGRQHADDGVGIALEPDVPADDRRIGADPVPEPMRQHDQVRATRADFVRGNGAPEHRRRAEHVEEVRRRDRHRDLDRIVALAGGEDPAQHGPEQRDVLDDATRCHQIGQVRPRQLAPLHVADRSVVAPHVVEVAGVAVRHRLDQRLADEGDRDGNHAQADRERGDGRRGKRAGAYQPADSHLGIAAPVAVPPPGCRRAQPLARSVPQRVHERPEPDAGQTWQAAAAQRVAGAVAIGLDQRLAHVVAEVGRIETLQQPEPPVGDAEGALVVHDFAPFGSRPPRRAARVSASSRRASAVAARRPASVMP